FTVPKARGRGKRRIAFRAPKGFQKGETVTIMAKNRRRRRPRTASGRIRKLAANRRWKTTTSKRRPARRRKARRAARNARRGVRVLHRAVSANWQQTVVGRRLPQRGAPCVVGRHVALFAMHVESSASGRAPCVVAG